MKQIGGETLLGGAERGGVPLLAVRIVDRNESRLATHRQTYVVSLKFLIYGTSQPLNFKPVLVSIGLGDARCLPDPADRHLMCEVDFAFFQSSRDGCSRRRLRRARKRQVSFARKQS